MYLNISLLTDVSNHTVLLVDDGIATGSSIRAAITILKQHQPKRIVVAVPVAPLVVCEELKNVVDEVVCLSMPEAFYAIGLWYKNFAQTTDSKVRNLLEKSSPTVNNQPTVAR